jgi:hypothetical protein
VTAPISDQHKALPHAERSKWGCEDDRVFRWRCECGAKGRLWEDRRTDAADGHRAHVHRMVKAARR